MDTKVLKKYCILYGIQEWIPDSTCMDIKEWIPDHTCMDIEAWILDYTFMDTKGWILPVWPLKGRIPDH